MKKIRGEIQWAYGITTVIERRDNLFPRTIESLKKAGFDKPRIFVDGEPDGLAYCEYGLEITVRHPKIRTSHHWLLTLLELYLRNPEAHRYAIFQDDFVTYRNLRGYLEKCEYPNLGYWNLYTFPKNQVLAKEQGWYESDQRGKGAVAIVFDDEAVKTLLSQKHLYNRAHDPRRGWRAIDGGIVTAFQKAIGKWREYVHNPSLVQHTGNISAMGNKPHAQATSFRGENFDALDLLK